jgi:hypothetical protein
MRCRLATLCLLICAATPAHGAASTATIGVSATVADDCLIDASRIAADPPRNAMIEFRCAAEPLSIRLDHVRSGASDPSRASRGSELADPPSRVPAEPDLVIATITY